MFSLGAVFYEVLVGRRAFRAETMHKILERVLVGQPDPIRQFLPEKPEGAWWPEQVADYMLGSLAAGDFYILCPDNDVDRATDEKRIAWNTGDIIENRPALSRWHPDHAADFEAFMALE